VLGVKSRREYLERLGTERAESLAIKKHAYAVRTDFGH
jgi:hypothetical protein